MNTLDYEDEGDSKGGSGGAIFSQLPIILSERKWLILWPFIIGLAIAVALALFLPKKYESAAILLVQAPSLPPEIIGSQADDAVAQRIEAIRQQIINRPALIAMIQQNDLYREERASEPLSGIVEDMRESIQLVPQTINLGSVKRDQTISVRLSYTYKDPVKAQAVAQQLMERVVEVDSTTNAEQLTGTVQFLTEQQVDLQRKISEAEGVLAAFNTRYGSVLTSGSLATLGGGGIAYDMQITNLQREIADLEAQKRLLQSADTRDPAVIQAEGALAAARARYTDSHPDVAMAKQRLEQAKAFALQNVARVPVQEIDARLNNARNQIAIAQSAKARETAQTTAAISQRAQSPAIQQQAAQLQQRVETLNKQFGDVSNRLLAARASQRAGEEQMGERLLVIDPPVVADTPTSPNRPLILALGAGLGLGLGFLIALAMEILLRPIRDPGVLAGITGAQPMAVIPVIGKPRKAKRRFGWFRSKKPRRQPLRKRKNTETRDDNEYLSA